MKQCLRVVLRVRCPVPDTFIFVGTVIAEAPQVVTRFPIEAMDSFRWAWVGLQITDVHAAFGHVRSTVSAADGSSPANGYLGGGELLDNAGFLPYPRTLLMGKKDSRQFVHIGIFIPLFLLYPARVGIFDENYLPPPPVV